MPTTKKSKKTESKKLQEQVLANRQGGQLDPKTHDPYEKAAALMQAEKRAYEEANRSIKTNIKKAYKNYLGVLDQPFDPYTQRRKIATTLTHDIVDSISKPVQISASSIKILPLTEESRGKAKVLNMLLPYFFQSMNFDGLMDLFKHRVAWLGTQITIQDWIYKETEESADNDPTEQIEQGFPIREERKNTKTRKSVIDRPRIQLTDPMDFFMPASAESIEWAIENASVIYRDVVPLDDIIGNPLYDEEVRATLKGRTMTATNTDDSTSLLKYSMSGYSGPGTARMMQSGETERFARPVVARYRRFGKLPKSWITEDENDALTMVDAIVESIAEDSTEYNFKTVCIRVSPFGSRGPFCDCRFNIIPKRYYGEGIGERLIPLQVWHNEIINTRRNNELLVQHRMYKIRKGKVDPRQLFSRPGGGIEVENMDDVMPLDTPDIPSSSFAEDNYILSSAQRLAGVALTPIQKKATATEIDNIQANANLTSTEFMGALENYLERLVNFHLLPLLKKYFTSDQSIPLTLSAGDMEQLDTFNGYKPFSSDQANELRFLIVDDPSLFDGDFAVTVDIEASGTNRGQQIAALNNLVALSSKIQGARVNYTMMFRKIAELSGVVDERLFEDAEMAMPTGVTSPNMMQMPSPGGSMQMPPSPMG